jgi:hypothetical protein
MQLSREDASLFFKLMPALQTFANQQLKIIEGLKEVEDYKTISDGERVELRNAVYNNPNVIEDFVRKNPFLFSQDELEIVSGWRNFVADSFFVVQLTKKYAIFMRDDDVYAVLGIAQKYRGFQMKEPFSACQVFSKRPLCNSLKAANMD